MKFRINPPTFTMNETLECEYKTDKIDIKITFYQLYYSPKNAINITNNKLPFNNRSSVETKGILTYNYIKENIQGYIANNIYRDYIIYHKEEIEQMMIIYFGI